MKNVYITGGTGFVGLNLQSYLVNEYLFRKSKKDEDIIIKEEIVIHLAGKAHDIKNVAQPEDYYQVNTELTKRVFTKKYFPKSESFLNHHGR